jgi:hypothetical protein
MGLNIKGGNNVVGRRAKKKKKKQASLCSANVAGGRRWHSREIKLKNLNVKVTEHWR